MKKLMMLICVLSISAFAQKAVLVDVISENIIKVNVNGEIKRLHLSGIELFSKANNATKNVTLALKEEFKKKTHEYITQHLKIGSEIQYLIINTTKNNVQKVWLQSKELNYKMVRDGYALVDVKDPYLPTTFQKRMTIAMNYAKNKKLGLWKDSNNLLALVDQKQHMCGWSNNAMVNTMNRETILKAQQDALPKSVRMTQRLIVAMK